MNSIMAVLKSRFAISMLLLAVLTACSAGFDGRYAILDREGNIRVDPEGKPYMILTVEGDSASLRMGGDIDLYRVTVIDDKLHLTPANGSERIIVLRKEGNQLVAEGPGGEDRLIRM